MFDGKNVGEGASKSHRHARRRRPRRLLRREGWCLHVCVCVWVSEVAGGVRLAVLWRAEKEAAGWGKRSKGEGRCRGGRAVGRREIEDLQLEGPAYTPRTFSKKCMLPHHA